MSWRSAISSRVIYSLRKLLNTSGGPLSHEAGLSLSDSGEQTSAFGGAEYCPRHLGPELLTTGFALHILTIFSILTLLIQ